MFYTTLIELIITTE